MNASVVICHQGDGEKTFQTALEAVATTAPVYVVALPEEISTLKASLPAAVQFLETSEKNLSVALSQAIQKIEGDIVRLDPGVHHLTSDGFEFLHQMATRDAQIGIVGIKLFADKETFLSCGRRIVNKLGTRPHQSNLGWGDFHNSLFQEISIVDSVAGACVYLKRKMLDAVGGYDPQFESNGTLWIEQDDLCLKAWSQGWGTVFFPHVAAIYDAVPMVDILKRFYSDQKSRLQWQNKWGWNDEFPDLHAIREKWGTTPICREIGEALLDNWKGEKYPEVDILLTTRNHCDRLKTLLPVLEKTDYSKFRILICNDASTDGTTEFLKNYRFSVPVEIISPPVNVGIHVGLNWLFSLSTASVVVRFDDEVTLPSFWLKRFVDTLRAHPYAGAVGGKLCAEERPEIIAHADARVYPPGPFEELCHTNQVDQGQVDYVSRVSLIGGSCLVYRRIAVEKGGVFEELLDDVHHILKVQFAGYDVLYDGMVKILHPSKMRTKKIDATYPFKWQGLGHLYGADVYEVLDRGLDLMGRRL